jgi:hypothetical protein
VSQDFFEHYWETERWKEVAREARPPTASSYAPAITSTYSGDRDVGGALRGLAKALLTIAMLPITAIGAFVSFRYLFGPWWAVLASLVCTAITLVAHASWIRE